MCIRDSGDVGLEQIDGDGLHDASVLRISDLIEMTERADYNECFPALRKSNVIVELSDGSVLESGTTEAPGDPEKPFTKEEVQAKFMRFTGKPLGKVRASELKSKVMELGSDGTLNDFNSLIYLPTR